MIIWNHAKYSVTVVIDDETTVTFHVKFLR